MFIFAMEINGTVIKKAIAKHLSVEWFADDTKSVEGP